MKEDTCKVGDAILGRHGYLLGTNPDEEARAFRNASMFLARSVIRTLFYQTPGYLPTYRIGVQAVEGRTMFFGSMRPHIGVRGELLDRA